MKYTSIFLLLIIHNFFFNWGDSLSLHALPIPIFRKNFNSLDFHPLHMFFLLGGPEVFSTNHCYFFSHQVRGNKQIAKDRIQTCNVAVRNLTAERPWLLLVTLRGLKHAPDNLWQHGTIRVSIPQAVREKIAFKRHQTNAVTDIYTNSS